MRKMIPSILIFFTCYCLQAQETGGADSSALSPRETLAVLAGYLGQTLESVIETQGYPEEMYPVRGPSDGQDSVVFLYSSRISFYWADRHVWQVRIDRDYKDGDLPVKPGMAREEVEALLGAPDLKKDDLSIYKLPQRGYPVACALYFDDGLTDLYIYRSDF